MSMNAIQHRRPCFALLIPLAIGACDRPDPKDRPLRPGQVLDFGRLYGQNCAGCHGADGQLGPAPPLNDPLFLAIASDDDLRRVISEGRAGTPMSPFARANGGGLTPAQVEAIITGIRARWGRATTQPAGPLPSYVATGKRWNQTAGASVYARTCAVCHGPNGEGTEKVGPLNSPAFLALISDQALRRIVITGRPDLGMPDYRHVADGSSRPGPLTDQEIEDVVALLASWRGLATTRFATATGGEP
jgi:cytochrome c oxidase cbb3-type subunit 3